MKNINNVFIIEEKNINLDNFITFDNKVLIVYDKNVKRHLDSIICDKTYLLEFDAIEDNKSLEYSSIIYEFLLKNNFNKSDYIIAFGGGITGDLVGYVAHTYKRGMNYINIPTTLLAQVDSSVGEKVAVNYNGIKNVIGGYKKAEVVICNVYYLRTLSKKDYDNSFSEIIKYMMISEFKLSKELRNNNFDITELIYECIRIKTLIVKEDPYDNGKRHILNYGHSFAHLIENKYKYSHAKSVAIGMLMVATIFENNKIKEELLYLYELYNVDYETNIMLDINLLLTDKKVNNNTLKEVIVNEVGNPEILKIDIKKYEGLYMEKWAN